MGRELRARITPAFDAEGIEIPFPQRPVWYRADGEPDEARARVGRPAEGA